MKIRVLIVDDEPLARKGVELRLREQPDMEVVEMCTNGMQAMQSILDIAPDLVFLDIQMPLMSGIEALRSIPEDALPTVIFLTAFDQHALAAFEVQALDYLLKPIDDNRFVAAIERARRLIALKRQSLLLNRSTTVEDVHLDADLDMASTNLGFGNPIKRFTIRNGKEVAFVEIASLDWIEAAGDYAQLHVGSKTYLIRESLNALETLLDPRDFLRVHRSSIIRLDRITRMTALPNRDGFLTLYDGTSVRVSRSYSKTLKDSLKSCKPGPGKSSY